MQDRDIQVRSSLIRDYEDAYTPQIVLPSSKLQLHSTERESKETAKTPANNASKMRETEPVNINNSAKSKENEQRRISMQSQRIVDEMEAALISPDVQESKPIVKKHYYKMTKEILKEEDEAKLLKLMLPSYKEIKPVNRSLMMHGNQLNLSNRQFKGSKRRRNQMSKSINLVPTLKQSNNFSVYDENSNVVSDLFAGEMSVGVHQMMMPAKLQHSSLQKSFK